MTLMLLVFYAFIGRRPTTCDNLRSPTVPPAGWDRDRARPAVGEGFPVLLFRLQGGFTVSPWRTFLDAPLKSRTARFPGSGSKPWHVRRVPSHGLERFKRWFVYTPATLGLPTASPLARIMH